MEEKSRPVIPVTYVRWGDVPLGEPTLHELEAYLGRLLECERPRIAVTRVEVNPYLPWKRLWQEVRRIVKASDLRPQAIVINSACSNLYPLILGYSFPRGVPLIQENIVPFQLRRRLFKYQLVMPLTRPPY